MSFTETINKLSALIADRAHLVENEEAVKMSLVAPVLQALGYDVFNPMEVVPEYYCDIGIKKGEKVDYAICDNNEPILLIECKGVNKDLNEHISQLYRYYTTTSARIAILTNGLVYKFFADTQRANIMDMTPFFEVDMRNLTDYDASQLLKFHKRYFNPDYICETIAGMRYVNQYINKLTATIRLNHNKQESETRMKDNTIAELKNVIQEKTKEIKVLSEKNRSLQERLKLEEEHKRLEQRKQEEVYDPQKSSQEELESLIEYLNMPVPLNWHDFNLQQRRNYYKNRKWSGFRRDYFCTPEVACEFYEVERKSLNVVTGRFVAGRIRMTKLFAQSGKKRRFGTYGSSLAWERIQR